MKMGFSCTRGAHFQGVRPPRSIQKSMKKRSKNGTLFCTAFGRFGEPFCDHVGIKIASKNRSKIQCDCGSMFERVWAHPVQDAIKTLPRCSQDAQGRQLGTPRGPKRAQHTSKLDFGRFFIEFSSMFFIDFSWIFHRFFIDVLICWDYSGSVLEVFWKYSGNILGLFWEYSGSILGVFWQYFGIILGVFWECSGKNRRAFRHRGLT